MSKTINLDILKQAERAGIRLVVDGPAWSHSDGAFPLDPNISPARCDVVAEARRVANMIATRGADMPEEVVYSNSTAALEAALKAMLAHIEKHMTKGKADAKQTDTAAQSGQQDAPDSDHLSDTKSDGDADSAQHSGEREKKSAN